MLRACEPQVIRKSLDRAAWHRPLISIVVTHFNYSEHIEDALLSLLDQSYENWECVLIDDASEPAHRDRLKGILHTIGSDRIRLIEHRENLGQIPAFYTGLDATSGEFVCLLDPDDRYAGSFLEEALACHLNEAVYCPVVCTEQMLLAGSGLVTGIYSWRNRARMSPQGGAVLITPVKPQLLYHEPHKRGWHWTSTSAMMFRRAALRFLRPHKVLAYKGSFDSYMANGAHMLGGTLFFTKPLVYRGLHQANAWITAGVYASAQNKQKTYGEERTAECIVDVTEAMLQNGAVLPKEPSPPSRYSLLTKWERSIKKRWRSLNRLLRLKNA